MSDYTRKPRKLVMVDTPQPDKTAVMADFIEAAQKLSEIKADHDALLDQWNAIVQASGSRTHVGAVGVVAETRRENDRLRELLRRALVVIELADVQTCLEVEIRKALDAT